MFEKQVLNNNIKMCVFEVSALVIEIVANGIYVILVQDEAFRCLPDEF